MPYSGLTLWTDGSKLDSRAAGTGITWKTSLKWVEKSVALDYLREIFDAELLEI